MSLTTGEASGLFRESAPARTAPVSSYKRAQAEADIRLLLTNLDLLCSEPQGVQRPTVAKTLPSVSTASTRISSRFLHGKMEAEIRILGDRYPPFHGGS